MVFFLHKNVRPAVCSIEKLEKAWVRGYICVHVQQLSSPAMQLSSVCMIASAKAIQLYLGIHLCTSGQHACACSNPSTLPSPYIPPHPLASTLYLHIRYTVVCWCGGIKTYQAAVVWWFCQITNPRHDIHACTCTCTVSGAYVLTCGCYGFVYLHTMPAGCMCMCMFCWPPSRFMASDYILGSAFSVGSMPCGGFTGLE